MLILNLVVPSVAEKVKKAIHREFDRAGLQMDKDLVVYDEKGFLYCDGQ
jgi:hypothetical protein